VKRSLLIIFLTGFIPGVATGLEQAPQMEESKQAIASFAGALKSELVSAMQNGGATEAIEVCNTRAGAISKEVSIEYGMQLTRTSQRYRNPQNAPNDWQSEVLQSFEDRKRAGEAVKTLAWSETIETESGKEFRFMKAIPTAGMCLQCHGAAIAPAVSAKLASLYPEDKATGFNQGDLRGAFVVTRQLD